MIDATIDVQGGDHLSSPPPSGPIKRPSGNRNGRRNQAACDFCHTHRVKCDSGSALSCSRCLRKGIHCVFTRQRRKRGRMSRRELADMEETCLSISGKEAKQAEAEFNPMSPPSLSHATLSPTTSPWSPVTNEVDMFLELYTDSGQSMPDESQPWEAKMIHTPEEATSPVYPTVDSPGLSTESLASLPPLPEIGDPVEIVFHSPIQEPATISISSPTSYLSPGNQSISRPVLKYPILNKISSLVERHLSPQAMCHLLESYFTCAFPNHIHGMYRHNNGCILRENSFLSHEFRPTDPSLLTSMLWIAAIDDRALSLFKSSSQQSRVCRFLRNLTMTLLQISTTAPPNSQRNADYSLIQSDASLDHVITYIHVAWITYMEQNEASSRWWKAGLALARRLKLNQETKEIPNADNMTKDSQEYNDQIQLDGLDNTEPFHHDNTQPAFDCIRDKYYRTKQSVMTEEHREERRRTWWMLYIMDRHFAFSHNHPPNILDEECRNLLLPLNEDSWQAAPIKSNDLHSQGLQSFHTGSQTKRQAFPDYSCRGYSIFGFLLPLTTITGQVMRLRSVCSQGNEEYEVQAAEVISRLEIYQTSLPTPMVDLPSLTVDWKTTNKAVSLQLSKYSWRAGIVALYASYFVQVLYILIVGKWDWLFLVEEKEFWTSPAFSSTISHTLQATSWLKKILEFDPDMSFMPYFFNIQLLHGSFPVLLIVERLQRMSGEDILNACEIILRATESCLVTRSTDHQRSFRQLMRGAVAQARGRPVSASEIQRRRKAVFALYLWMRRAPTGSSKSTASF
ncbi:hypothetical protein N7478_000451 [Penicillium angulare]|uniref:uncharacterized protein n=1 Tax=Penicillium angulare TaxID=116970 RepID=UPI0025425958|nr:uncharacterized protein N7478_000451 [Penicillium angulare]KAJ5291200.1 hypothetical protein N7478_000451 [Penicillium angulare]